MDQRKVSAKNYIIYVLVVLISFIFIFSLAKAYSNYKEEKEGNSLMKEVVVEIYSDNVDSFMLENDNVAIYLASSNDQNLKEFEKEFKEYIIEKQINEKIVFLNLSLANENFLKEFIKDYYPSSITSFVSPNLVLVSENKIIDILYFSPQTITMEDVSEFLIEHEVSQ